MSKKSKIVSPAMDFNIDVQLVIMGQRTLFGWRDDPPEPAGYTSLIDDAEDFGSLIEDYHETIFMDSVLQRLLASKTFLGMLREQPSIGDVPIVFRYLKNNAAASYCDLTDNASVSQSMKYDHGSNIAVYVYLAAHEFRHAWHKRVGIFSGNEGLSLESMIALNRAYEADCAAFQTSVAWDFLLLGDNSHWRQLKRHKGYSACANAFEKVMTRYEEELDDWDWHQALEDGDYADETGAAQQAAFEEFFRQRGLKVAYDAHAINTFKDAANNHAKKLSATEDKRLLESKLALLSSMPYMNEKGRLSHRPEYDPTVILSPKRDREFLSVHESGTRLKIKHALRVPPPRPVR